MECLLERACAFRWLLCSLLRMCVCVFLRGGWKGLKSHCPSLLSGSFVSRCYVLVSGTRLVLEVDSVKAENFENYDVLLFWILIGIFCI